MGRGERVGGLEPLERVAQRPGDGRARPLGRGARDPGTASEPEGTGELGDEVVAVPLGELLTRQVGGRARLLEVLLDLAQAPAVGLTGLVVEDRDPGLVG